MTWRWRGLTRAQDNLINASRIGDLEAVHALLAANADVNTKDAYGYTALMSASKEGHLKVVRALLAANADVNAKDAHGHAALMWASWNGRLHVVQSPARCEC